MTRTEDSEGTIPPRLLGMLILTAALTVGNIYISQPLLGSIAQSFAESPARTGMIPALSQIGYVVALIFVAPLGDVVSPRKLLLWLLAAAGVILLGCTITYSFPAFCLASLGVGLSAVQAQVVLPYIAAHSSTRDRGRNLGLFMSACLTGVLLSRTLSGYLGQHLPSWRMVYLLWGLSMLALAYLVYRLLPETSVATKMPYFRLVGSLLTLLTKRRALRRIALTGALVYGALSAFWAALAFYLGSPAFRLGTDTVGAFGLIGAGGALASGLIGRQLDRVSAKSVLLGSVALMSFSFLAMGFAGTSLMMLVISVVLLDMGAQAASISNQSEIYRLYSDAQSRLNTLYKIFYFTGGAAGSALSTWAWQHHGWWGVCLTGVGFSLLAAVNILTSKREITP